MNKQIKTWKENKDILYIYKIPCSLFTDSLYILIGNIKTSQNKNIWKYSLNDWFEKIELGDILPYICNNLPNKLKLKVYLSIYNSLDITKFRNYILHAKLSEVEQILQLSCANQILIDGKFYYTKQNEITQNKTELQNTFLQLTEGRLTFKRQKQHEI